MSKQEKTVNHQKINRQVYFKMNVCPAIRNCFEEVREKEREKSIQINVPMHNCKQGPAMLKQQQTK